MRVTVIWKTMIGKITIEEPIKPIELKLGKKPKEVKQWEKEKAKLGDNDHWKWERCPYCLSVIGKDYGSFYHTCEEGAIIKKYLEPQTLYAANLRNYKKDLKIYNFYLSLKKFGIEEEDAVWIAQNADATYTAKLFMNL